MIGLSYLNCVFLLSVPQIGHLRRQIAECARKNFMLIITGYLVSGVFHGILWVMVDVTSVPASVIMAWPGAVLDIPST